MNREDIIRMAREAEMTTALVLPDLERFAALVAAAEREACEKACEHQPHWVACAAAIRARGNP